MRVTVHLRVDANPVDEALVKAASVSGGDDTHTTTANLRVPVPTRSSAGRRCASSSHESVESMVVLSEVVLLPAQPCNVNVRAEHATQRCTLPHSWLPGTPMYGMWDEMVEMSSKKSSPVTPLLECRSYAKSWHGASQVSQGHHIVRTYHTRRTPAWMTVW